MLELGRFDHRSDPPPSLPISSSASARGLDRIHSVSNEDTASSSTPLPHESSSTPVPADNGAVTATTGDVTSAPPTQRHKKQFTSFHFRKRTVDRNVAGPALAVVDAESNPVGSPPGLGGEGGENNHDEKKTGGEKDEDSGVKVTIKLAALDEEGRELESVNEQTTYLHIVRFGAPVEGEVEEDKRPWVVKVVKREATVRPFISCYCHLQLCSLLTRVDRSSYFPPARNLWLIVKLDNRYTCCGAYYRSPTCRNPFVTDPSALVPSY